MRRMVSVHPIRPGAAERYTAWCQELHRRRDEFDASRRAAGITRQVFWLQPDHELGVVRTDAYDPLAALQHVRDAAGRFDRWYRRREHEVHGPALVDAGHPPELLTDDRAGEIEAHDRFVAFAVPLLRPDRTNEFRAGIRAGEGHERTRRWALKRMAIWLQHAGGRDVAVYELAGDITAMVRALTEDEGPEIRMQREFLDEVFGIDVGAGQVPLPVPAFAWSVDHASRVAP